MELEQKYSIAYKGLKNGLHEEDFDVDGTLFKAYESKDIKDGRCKVHVAMQKSDSQLILNVGIDGEVTCECDRCLEDCTIPVHFDGTLTVYVSDPKGEYDGDSMWISPEEEDVNLMQYIYESIVLSLPYRRVHPDGECDPDMLARFTVATDDDIAQEAAADDAEAAETHGIGAENMEMLEALKNLMQNGKNRKE